MEKKTIEEIVNDDDEDDDDDDDDDADGRRTMPIARGLSAGGLKREQDSEQNYLCHLIDNHIKSSRLII